MSGDLGDDLIDAWGKSFNATRSVDERRKREAKPMSTSTRRRAYMGESKTVQLNLKITPSLRAKLEAMAIARRCALVDVFEMAMDALEGQGK